MPVDIDLEGSCDDADQYSLFCCNHEDDFEGEHDVEGRDAAIEVAVRHVKAYPSCVVTVHRLEPIACVSWKEEQKP